MSFKNNYLYTRDESHDEVGGGSKQAYLPNKNGRVLCACLNQRENPSAPFIILAGKGPEIQRSSIMLCDQKGSIPVFVKRNVNKWEYVGMHEIDRWTDKQTDIDDYNRTARRTDITRIIFTKESV